MLALSYMYASFRLGTVSSTSPKAAPGSRPSSKGDRAAWGTISRARIVDAASRLVATEGYEQLTIRRLAADLGVAPMSLYRHVRDKNDVLDEVVDRLLAKAWQPRANQADWQAWIAEAADRLRDLLVTEPAVLAVYLSHPVITAAAIARMEAMLTTLRLAIGDEEARRAYGAIQGYTIGFAALEASRARWQPDEGTVNALAQQLAAYTSPPQFALGLDYILRGMVADRVGAKKPRRQVGKPG
jgi:AcrR family transcriptional regulator